MGIFESKGKYCTRPSVLFLAPHSRSLIFTTTARPGGLAYCRRVLNPQEVAAANAAVDAHREEFELEPGKSEPFTHIEGMLGWPKGEREPFVGMLAQ